MSWLSHMAGGESPPIYRDPLLKKEMKDPNIPDRMISNKAPNRPFLAYKAYRDQQNAQHAAWVERQRDREAMISRGEKVGPPEPDPTAEKEVGLLGLMKLFFFLIISIALIGKFITGSYTWEYDAKWLSLKTLRAPGTERLFSERFLAEFDGSIPGKPIYLAIDGDVYDVSSGNAYKPGGSYSILAGVDAARAFGTGCFQTHRTHDLRGLSERELKSVDRWKGFYAEHKDYIKVGRVSHPSIDPMSPIPEHCDRNGEILERTESSQNHGKDDEVKHLEL